MVNRSPTSNFQFRHCHIRNMAPQNTGSSSKKGKQIKRLAGKFPPGSAPCSETKEEGALLKMQRPHFPPTGRACQKVESAHHPRLVCSSSPICHPLWQIPGATSCHFSHSLPS